MKWKQLKRTLGEIEEVIIKLAAIISLILLISQLLWYKFSEVLAAWRQ